MKRIFKTVEDHLIECTTLEKGCWVHLQSPTKEEIDGLNTRFALDPPTLPPRWTKKNPPALSMNRTRIRR